jgi:hypothetical protein
MRPKYKIARTSYTIFGTWGVLHRQEKGFAGGEEDLPIAVTLENPWIDNLPRVSCIPCGLYLCKRVDSPKFGDTFEICDVAERTHILFHSGNFETDTLGCVLVASKFGVLSNTPAVLDSKIAFRNFLDGLEDINEFELAIVDCDGLPF